MGVIISKCKGTKKIIKVKKLTSVEALTAKQNKIIDVQLSKFLCQITTEKLEASGFLCRIPNIKNPVLITTNHVLDETQIKPGMKINIYFTDEKNNKYFKTIKIDETRTTYTVKEIDGENIDTTIIELKPDEDYLNDKKFIEIDEELMNENTRNTYLGQNVYVIHYKGGEEISKSTGIIEEMIKIDKSYIIYHTRDTDGSSSGSPIILYNNKVIGLQRGDIKSNNFNVGTLLKYPIKEYCEKLRNKKIKRYNSVLDKFKVIKEKKVNINNNGLNENYLDDEIIKFSKPISNYYKIHKKKYHNSSTYDKTIDNNTSKKSLQNKRNTVEEIPKNLELKIIKQIDYKKLLDKKESENKKQDNNDESEKRKSNSGDGLENELYNNKSFKNPFSISGMKNSKYKNDRYNEKYSLHYFNKINNDSI